MQNGAAGHLTGAHAVAIVRGGENQFLRSQGQERVFRKPMEVRPAPPLKTKPEITSSQCTRKNRPALNSPIAPNLQRWGPGENGLPVHKHAIMRVSQYLKPKAEDPARKQSSLQMKPLTRVWPHVAS